MASRSTSPTEPTRKHPPPVQPNAHPYAVKTTSTALLSRSNTTPHSAHHTRHHYIPSPPSRVPTGTRVRHRHSSSLSSVEGEGRDVNAVRTIPAPLPTPPSIVAAQDNPPVPLGRADELKLSQETMPSSATEPITENQSYDQKHKFSCDQDTWPELCAGLPSNPKQWNTDQLTTYLEASFKLGSNSDGDRADSSFVNMLECVRTRGFTGRELLRLTDADLAGTPLSDVQRTQLLERSRTLRAYILRGRIHADSYYSHEISDNSNDIYSQSARTSTALHTHRGASASADDLRLLLDNNTGKDEYALPPSPVMSLHRSNSVSDASAQRYRDLACMRMRRRGRVRGLVETWERASTSGSECSASEESSVSGSDAESESEIDREFESISESPSDLPSTLHDLGSSATDSAVVPQEPPLLTPPPPYTHMYTTLGVLGDQEEEPSIEELLATSSNIPLRGARAWEADFGLGETVKRVPVSASADASSTSPLVMEPDTSRRLKGSGKQTKDGSLRSGGSGMRRSIGSRGKNAKTRKRVVTAIFTGSPSEDASSDGSGEMHSGVHHRHTSDVSGVVRSEAPASSDLQCDPESALRALEESIEITRTQLEAFRLRLEKVEADTSRQEAMLMRAQLSDSRQSTGSELRQRRLGANETPTAKSAEPPRDQTFVDGAGHRDVLEGWETMSLTNIARAIAASAMGWLFPYGHLGIHVPEGHDAPRARTGSRPGTNDRRRSPAKKNSRWPVARMSCSIILVSFAICAAILRRLGFGRWVRRP